MYIFAYVHVSSDHTSQVGRSCSDVHGEVTRDLTARTVSYRESSSCLGEDIVWEGEMVVSVQSLFASEIRPTYCMDGLNNLVSISNMCSQTHSIILETLDSAMFLDMTLGVK